MAVAGNTWTLRGDVLEDNAFPHRAVVSTRRSGNMRDAALRTAFLGRLSIDGTALVTAEQVHGAAIAVVTAQDRGKRFPATDGLITATPGVPCAVLTADCLPVFLGSTGRLRAAGVVHAGWRGLASGIVKRAVEIFGREFGIPPAEIAASVGPHIQKCCYTVGRELKERFGVPGDDPRLDLAEVCLRQLKEAGVKRVSMSGRCTAHDEEIFFSYRRDKTDERILSMVMI